MKSVSLALRLPVVPWILSVFPARSPLFVTLLEFAVVVGWGVVTLWNFQTVDKLFTIGTFNAWKAVPYRFLPDWFAAVLSMRPFDDVSMYFKRILLVGWPFDLIFQTVSAALMFPYCWFLLALLFEAEPSGWSIVVPSSKSWTKII